MSSNLPHTVEVWLDNIYKQLDGEGFFNENDFTHLNKEESIYIFREIVGGEALKMWMDVGDVNLSPDVLTRLLFEMVLRAHIEVLKKEGFIDSMYDDEGNEHLWLTPQGKTKMDNLQEDFFSILHDSGMENEYMDDNETDADDDLYYDEDE